MITTLADHGGAHEFGRGTAAVVDVELRALGRPGDVLVAISTSGNSANVLRAAEVAKAQGMSVIGLTGKDGGRLAPLCTVEVRVPHKGYADRVQEIHIKVIHAWIDHIEQAIAAS